MTIGTQSFIQHAESHRSHWRGHDGLRYVHKIRPLRENSDGGLMGYTIASITSTSMDTFISSFATKCSGYYSSLSVVLSNVHPRHASWSFTNCTESLWNHPLIRQTRKWGHLKASDSHKYDCCNVIAHSIGRLALLIAHVMRTGIAGSFYWKHLRQSIDVSSKSTMPSTFSWFLGECSKLLSRSLKVF